MKDLAFSDASAKLAVLNDGLRFGSQGASGTKRVIDLAIGLIEQYAPEQRMLAPRIRERLRKELDTIPTKILSEYFAKPSVSQELFSVAKELEAAAYKSVFVVPQALSPTAKGIIGALLDFWDMDRKGFLNTIETTDGSTPTASPGTRPVVEASPQPALPGLEPKKFRV